MQRVKLIQFNDNLMIEDLTIGKVYEVIDVDSDGDVFIYDDKGELNNLFVGEFEAVVVFS